MYALLNGVDIYKMAYGAFNVVARVKVGCRDEWIRSNGRALTAIGARLLTAIQSISCYRGMVQERIYRKLQRVVSEAGVGERHRRQFGPAIPSSSRIRLSTNSGAAKTRNGVSPGPGMDESYLGCNQRTGRSPSILAMIEVRR